ncbi:MAG: hypothetical protein N3F10_04655 [Candidatus Bathyarchaeota archaeon]|nr:hypothetical protein [Candidatus Bathyarchaeota archaeon]
MEKVSRELGLLEKMLRYVPGYRGYKEKEMRRETDRLVRMEVVDRIKSAKNTLKRALSDPFYLRRFSEEDAWRLDTLLSRLDRVEQRVEHAVAGYAGMFDSVKVREDKLDAILQHDLSLIEKVDVIRDGVETLVKNEVGAEWRGMILNLISRVDELDALVNKRAEILMGLTV